MHLGMCSPNGYGFSAVLVIAKVMSCFTLKLEIYDIVIHCFQTDCYHVRVKKQTNKKNSPDAKHFYIIQSAVVLHDYQFIMYH